MRNKRSCGFFPSVPRVDATLKLLGPEIESRVDEIVDLLRFPAGEFRERVRGVLIEFLHAAARRLSDFENADTDPHIKAPVKPFTTPPKAPPRPPQETMEITLDQLVGPWSVTTGRDR